MSHATVTEIPTALPDVDEGVVYAFQVKGGRSINIEVAASAPSADSDDAKTAPYSGSLSVGRFKTNSGESVFVWITGDHGEGFIVYDEAP